MIDYFIIGLAVCGSLIFAALLLAILFYAWIGWVCTKVWR